MTAALKGSKTPLHDLAYVVEVELPGHLRHLVDLAAVLLGSNGRDGRPGARRTAPG